MPAPADLRNLVERFTRNHARLRDASYKEAQHFRFQPQLQFGRKSMRRVREVFWGG